MWYLRVLEGSPSVFGVLGDSAFGIVIEGGRNRETGENKHYKSSYKEEQAENSNCQSVSYKNNKLKKIGKKSRKSSGNKRTELKGVRRGGVEDNVDLATCFGTSFTIKKLKILVQSSTRPK